MWYHKVYTVIQRLTEVNGHPVTELADHPGCVQDAIQHMTGIVLIGTSCADTT